MSKSGKQVQFIDNQGNVFVTSTNYLASILMGTLQKEMIILAQLPLGVHPGRYPKSPMYDPQGLLSKAKEFKEGMHSENQDVMSYKGKEFLTENKQTQDYNPW
jgi:hypothetical protein